MVFRRRTNLRVRPRKKDSPKYISLIAFSQTYTHWHSDWHTHTSSCNHSLVSHQLNFLSQIIFHFPEAAQKQGRNFSQTPFEKKSREDIVRARFEKDSSHSRSATWKARPKCFYFKIYHLQLSSKFVRSCPHLSLTFLRWRALCPLPGWVRVSS